MSLFSHDVNYMKLVDETRNWRGKQKDLVTFLTEIIVKDENLFPQIVEILKLGSNVEKGTAADVMKHVSREKPGIVAPYVNDMLDFINSEIPRVKWGLPEAIGNMAAKFPMEVENAIPYLVINTQDKSTVVRWCAAFALTEIAKYNLKVARDFKSRMKEIAEKENNNGVRNVYLKFLRSIK